MAAKKIKRPLKPEDKLPLDVPVDIIEEINSSSSSREDRVRRLQEQFDLPKEIAERLVHESE